MKRTLSTMALLAACGGQDRADRPPPAARPAPELTAMFGVVVRAGLAAAEQARTRPPQHPVELSLNPPPSADIELRYQRGMRDYPSDLVDRQAEAARVAVERCLADRDDVADLIDPIGTVSLTVRIDHDQEPAQVRVVGGHGLETCVQRKVDVMPADGIFLAVVRITR